MQPRRLSPQSLPMRTGVSCSCVRAHEMAACNNPALCRHGGGQRATSSSRALPLSLARSLSLSRSRSRSLAHSFLPSPRPPPVNTCGGASHRSRSTHTRPASRRARSACCLRAVPARPPARRNDCQVSDTIPRALSLRHFSARSQGAGRSPRALPCGGKEEKKFKVCRNVQLN
jgi:hypothetical protein